MLNRGNVLCFLFFFVIVLFGTEQTSAQLLKAPLPAKALSKSKSGDAGRKQALPPKELPFWDDFSFPDDGMYPQDTLWENSNAVWITRGIGANTPSIYSATFDGINANGNPYSQAVLENGYRDTLTSRALRLDVIPNTPVDRGKTYLSFYYQWGGNGEAPNDTDYLQLDFKNSDGIWEEQFRIYPRPGHDRTVFYDTLIPIGADKYFHEEFQFRFLSYGRNSGPFDTWNLDYVYLHYDRNTLLTHPDRSVASEISPLFEQYRSIPLEHFLEDGKFARLKIDLMNFKRVVPTPAVEADVVDFSILGSFKNTFQDGTHSNFNSAVLFDSIDFRLPHHQRTQLTMSAFPDTTNNQQFDPAAIGVDIRLTAVLTSYDLTDLTKKAIDKTDRRINDTISSVQHLRDFYAYDDGIPEHSVYLTQPNNIGVVEYNLLVENDFLKGIDIYFPDYGITSTQTMDFVVYIPDESNQQPADEPYVMRSDPSMKKDTVTGFYRVEFYPTVLMPKKFYIGWVAPPLGKPKVGVDVSNDSGDKIFTKVNGVWRRNEDNHHSSIMIRPVFGEGLPPTGVEEEGETIVLFPNPNRGEFFITGKHDQLNIMNVTGQPIAFEQELQGDRTKVSIQSAPGLYLLRIKDGNRIKTEKFILVP